MNATCPRLKRSKIIVLSGLQLRASSRRGSMRSKWNSPGTTAEMSLRRSLQREPRPVFERSRPEAERLRTEERHGGARFLRSMDTPVGGSTQQYWTSTLPSCLSCKAFNSCYFIFVGFSFLLLCPHRLRPRYRKSIAKAPSQKPVRSAADHNHARIA